MVEAVAPAGQGQIVVDAHEVYVGIGAERIEVEIHIPAAVLRIVVVVSSRKCVAQIMLPPIRIRP